MCWSQDFWEFIFALRKFLFCLIPCHILHPGGWPVSFWVIPLPPISMTGVLEYRYKPPHPAPYNEESKLGPRGLHTKCFYSLGHLPNYCMAGVCKVDLTGNKHTRNSHKAVQRLCPLSDLPLVPSLEFSTLCS